MTKFESNAFDFVSSIFGRESAEKFFCFCVKSIAAFMYMGYIFTLPFQFAKLFYKNLKEKGVI